MEQGEEGVGTKRVAAEAHFSGYPKGRKKGKEIGATYPAADTTPL